MSCGPMTCPLISNSAQSRAWIVLRAVHWFNPLVWLAYRCVRRNRELACDETVLANTQNEEKERYGRTIIRILELGSG
ncbi:MAG: hypothetical protein HY674_13975, partial [Chloroflexi bacterium]|nr:hypothetical protein [Chloroflexota bacterium]